MARQWGRFGHYRYAMATERQALGNRGERLIVKTVKCPGCKSKERTLRLLPPNFKCADIICDFCGYLAQVKTKSVRGNLPDTCPPTILGAAWAPQRDRMSSGVYFSLFIVLESDLKATAIYFLPRELQTPEMFIPRKPLSSTAKRAGWQGYMIDLKLALGPAVPLLLP